MTRTFLLSFVLVLAVAVTAFLGQMGRSEAEFLLDDIAADELLPDLTVYDPEGKELNTSSLRGHYTVLTFGCLTLPPFLWNVSGLEAVYRDYGPKGVKFFFIYKALAHPELAGNYVQPFTQEERLAQGRQARVQLGASIPWIVDAIDNRLKHALGDRPNSEFIIDPNGRIVRKRAWSHPEQVRKDLEVLVGPVERITRESDVRLMLESPVKMTAPLGVVPRVKRSQMQALQMEPRGDPKGLPFYAKLRAEADIGVFLEGNGKVYLGFHIDPLHRAHWNNLTSPLQFSLETPKGVTFGTTRGEGPKVTAATDAGPREFLLDVEAWPEDKPVVLTVRYFVCIEDKSCLAVQQSYLLHRRHDRDGGGVRGEGAGFWDPEDFARQTLSRSGDGKKVSKAEVFGLVRPQFEKLDTNNDGYLDLEELKKVAEWLNQRHQPGTPSASTNELSRSGK